MIKLRNLPYNEDFYWQGQRYVQYIKPKKPTKNKHIVTCYLKNDPCGGYIDMPLGRTVKEIVRIDNE